MPWNPLKLARFAGLALLVWLTASQAGADDIYQNRATWAEGMTATRQKLAQLGLKDVKLSEWFATEPAQAESIAAELFPGDKVDRGTRNDGREVLRDRRNWGDGRINLELRPKTVRYLYREIHAGQPGVEELKFGCDSPVMIWLGDERVYSGQGGAKCEPGQVTIPLNLRKGKNPLRMKVYSEPGGGQFSFDLPAAQLDRDKVYEDLFRTFWEDFPETDWFIQDNPQGKPGAEDVNPVRDFGWYFDPARNNEPEQLMIRRALDERNDPALAERLDRLVKANASPNDPAWLALYAEACALRRQERLKPLATMVPRFVFTKHYTLGGSHYAYTEGQSDAQAERHFVAGSALCLAEWDGKEYRVATLVEDAGGVIRDPDVSFDGKRVLFAWKKSDREDDYHLYELTLADRSIRQLTDGLGVADYEPAYLPDGDILFNSTRCVQTVDCWWTEVSNIYRSSGDGRFLRRLTFDQVHDNYPTVTEDGRILYTRWEYNDRGQIYPQPLLQMNPDGTGQQEFYGVNSWFPTTILHARGVPGTQKVLAIATGHHSRQTGKLILIDPAKGRQENEGVQLVAPPRETPAVKIDSYGQSGELFQYPYPLSETEYLVTYHPRGWTWSGGHRNWRGNLGPRFAVYFTMIDGRRERLVADPAMPCSQSVPVRPRTCRTRPAVADYRRSEGTCYVQDVFAGPGLAGVDRGKIKTLRVVALEFRAAGVGSNGNGGPGGGALVSTPVAIGNGSWDPKVVLGDAQVHEDGSAFFRVPARTPIFFQLLDEKGRLVQTMRSWTTLQPGENAACVGCHEKKNSTPMSAMPVTVAVRRGVEPLKPFYGEPRGFSFARDIQPILDRQCVRCHKGEDKTPYDLTAKAIEDPRAKRRWTQSYLALTHSRPDEAANNSGWRGNADHPMVNWVSAQSAPPMLSPYSVGSAKSKLIALLDAGHEDVKLTREEMDKLCTWIDLAVPFCGDYIEGNAWEPAEVEKYRSYAEKRKRLAGQEQVNITEWVRHRGGE